MENDMKLPEGKTCRDCYHFHRCSWLISANGHETECDWSPSRFRPKTAGESKSEEPCRQS